MLISKDWNSGREEGLLASPFHEDDLLDPERRTGLQLLLLEALRVLPTYLIYPHDTPERYVCLRFIQSYDYTYRFKFLTLCHSRP